MSLWNIFRTTFSNLFPVVYKRLIGRTFWWNFGCFRGFGNLIAFQSFGISESRRQWLIKYLRRAIDIHGRCLKHSFGIPSSPRAFLSFNKVTHVDMSQGFNFRKEVSTTDASRAWTLLFTCHSCFCSHRSWYVNWFSKESAIVLAFSFMWYIIPKGPWIAVSAFDPFRFLNDFTLGHRSWGVTSQFPTLSPKFACLSPDSFGDPVICRFTWWILCCLPQFP
jgi:hypothetical protein